jgi:2-C-methyl-D-erythritol 4-phosphate cytidylyltransferase
MGKLGIIIVAAGKGTRMGTAESKQYLPIGGKPILVHTLELFERMEEVSDIVLVVSAGEEGRCRTYIDTYGLCKVTRLVTGGSERQSSVHRGLDALEADVEWVMVHDAVRPFVRPADVRACLAKAKETNAAVLAVPVKDTIKLVNSVGEILSTPDRRSLWAMQTPQAFRASNLLRAYEQAEREGFLGTDDASLAERAGMTVHIVEGSYDNFKITTREDLRMAEYMLRDDGEDNGR